MNNDLREFKADFFKALSSPLRISILDELRSGELTVTELRLRLDIEPAHMSQHLAILKAKNIVVGRKQGSNIYYSCRDRAIFEMLDIAKKIFKNQLRSIKGTLEAL